MIAKAAALLMAAILVADGGATGVLSEIRPQNNPTVIQPEEVLEVVSEPEPMHLYGVCTITHYCHCAKCNGRAGANCASGVQPTVNHTVASNCLPFGTRLMIDGQEYVVEDRGDANMDSFWIDIFVGSHEEALQRGMYKSEVWIIDE